MPEARSAVIRQRANAVGNVVPSGSLDYSALVRSLPFETVDEILTRAAEENPDVGIAIMTECSKIASDQGDNPEDFDRYSFISRIMEAISYDSWSPSQRNKENLASVVAMYIETIIARKRTKKSVEIFKDLNDAVPADACFHTKKRALKSLLESAKTFGKIWAELCQAGCQDPLKPEMKQEVKSVIDCLKAEVERIAKTLTVAELTAIKSE